LQSLSLLPAGSLSLSFSLSLSLRQSLLNENDCENPNDWRQMNDSWRHYNLLEKLFNGFTCRTFVGDVSDRFLLLLDPARNQEGNEKKKRAEGKDMEGTEGRNLRNPFIFGRSLGLAPKWIEIEHHERDKNRSESEASRC
jgi:hypothetical protein